MEVEQTRVGLSPAQKVLIDDYQDKKAIAQAALRDAREAFHRALDSGATYAQIFLTDAE